MSVADAVEDSVIVVGDADAEEKNCSNHSLRDTVVDSNEREMTLRGEMTIVSLSCSWQSWLSVTYKMTTLTRMMANQEKVDERRQLNCCQRVMRSVLLSFPETGHDDQRDLRQQQPRSKTARDPRFDYRY